MAPPRPPGRGKSSPRGPRSTSGHAGTRRPKPGTNGPSNRKGPQARKPGANGPADRKGPQARREAQPFRAKPAAPRKSASNRADSGADRLQKILAHAGVGSRRACEELILEGRVTVGGQVVKELGTKVDLAKNSIAVDGQKIHQERLVYFAVNKPKGYVSTNNDPSGRPRVLDLLPNVSQRVYTVGRLDEMSVGLMLLTNDGELANKLAHPKFGVEKLYRVIVAGTPERETLNQLTEGIWLAEGKVRAKRVRAVAKKGEATILEMVLAEGKNREVRRMLAKLGHKVMMLTRVAVGPITIKGLTAGQVRPLTGREVDLLKRVAAGEPVPMPWDIAARKRPEGDRPHRPFGAGAGPANDRRGGREDAPPMGPRGGDRPHGPGYRPPEEQRSRPPGPSDAPPRGGERRPGGPPRRPGMFQAPLDDTVIRPGDDRRPGPGGDRRPGPVGDRRGNGPRPYGRQDGPPGGPRPYGRQDGPPGGPRGYGRQDGPPGGPRPYGRQDGPQDGGRDTNRPGGPRPYGRQDGPQDGPRPYGRQGGPPGGPRPYGRQDGPQGGPRGDGRPGGARPYGPPAGDSRDDRRGPPRPDQRREGPPGRPGQFAEGGPRPPRPGQRPGGDRPTGGNDRRPAGDDRQRGPASNGNSPGDRRPRPSGRPSGPGSPEPKRKVIGLGNNQAPPPPAPTNDGGDDRPKPRLKRPAPRGAAPGAPRAMPKRRIARRDDD